MMVLRPASPKVPVPGSKNASLLKNSVEVGSPI